MAVMEMRGIRRRQMRLAVVRAAAVAAELRQRELPELRWEMGDQVRPGYGEAVVVAAGQLPIRQAAVLVAAAETVQ